MGRKTNFISDDIATTVVPTTPANPQVGEPCGIGDIPGVVVEPPPQTVVPLYGYGVYSGCRLRALTKTVVQP